MTGSSKNVSPAGTTTYTLTATSAAGVMSTAQFTVTVVPPPTISSFVATPSTLASGATTVLSWAVTSASTLSIDNGVGSVTGTSVSVTPTATTTYTLAVANAAGTTVTSTATVTVTVHNQLALLAGTVGDQGPSVTFDYPAGNAVDADGNVYVADAGNNTIEKITSAGVVTTLAGSGIIGSSDGTGTAATFSKPMGIAVDASGNLYVTDTNNYTIRKINPAGLVTTLAGSAGVGGSTDGTGSAATFSYPVGIAVDSTGNLFVTEDATYNKPVRKITPAGVVTTLYFAYCNVAPLQGIAVDASDNVYVVSDVGNTICKISPAGGTTIVAGSSSGFSYPTGIAVDSSGNVFVSDTNNGIIRKVTSAGMVTTFAGSGILGSADGTGSASQFNKPMGISVDLNGNLYVSDNGNKTVRKISSAGIVTTLAGSPGNQGSADGTGSAARFDQPTGIAIDASGNLYVADTLNSAVRKITQAGVVTTLVPSTAGLRYPTGIAVGASGNIDVLDSRNNEIYQIGFGDMVFQAGKLTGMAIDATGNFYVTDVTSCSIDKFTFGGSVSILAGNSRGSADGSGTSASFNFPTGIAVDASGNVYVADSKNATIRKVTSVGVVTTLAGLAGHKGDADGTGSDARFSYPIGIAVDASGNLYVTDFGNDSVRKITQAGVVTTIPVIAGGAGTSSITLDAPVGIAIDSSGKLYITDDNGVLTLVP